MNTIKMDMKNENGFGLLSTIVAMGIAATLFLGTMEMLAVSASAQRGVQIKADRTFYTGELTNILLHDPTCTPSLKGNEVSQSMVMKDPVDATRKVAEAGMHFPAWNISSIELKNQQLVDPAMKLYSGDVVITLNHPYRVIGVTPTYSKQMATIYYTVDEGKISRCFGTTNWASVGKTYCSTMGGNWSDADFKCTLPAAAPTVVAGTSSAPSDNLTVAEVVASAKNDTDVTVKSNPSADVVTGVDHPVGKSKL